MKNFHNFSLALCVIFSFTLTASAQNDSPDIREIFADSILRQKLLDETIYKDRAPNLLLNNLFQMAINSSVELTEHDLGKFRVVEFMGESGSERLQQAQNFYVTTNGHKSTTYYTLYVDGIVIQWSDDAEDPGTCRISDMHGNTYARNGWRSWTVMRGKGISAEKLQKVFHLLLNNKY